MLKSSKCFDLLSFVASNKVIVLLAIQFFPLKIFHFIMRYGTCFPSIYLYKLISKYC